MFCEIIGKIISASPPMNGELALAYAVFDPVKTHIHGFGAALFHGIIDDARHTCVICLDWCGTLRVTQVG